MLLRSIRTLTSAWKFVPTFAMHHPVLATSKLTSIDQWKPLNINTLHDNPGARRYPKIVGRGPGSGKGKTAGRGVKGFKARSGGGVHHRFEGGQAPLNRRLPKYNGKKLNHERIDYVNVSTLIYYIKRGVLQPNKPITIKHLVDAGIVKKVKYGVKILAKGITELETPLQLEVSDASKSVIDKINALGGRVTCIYRTPRTLTKLINPEKYRHAVEQPIPAKRRVRQLDRIQARGAEVVYKRPQWKRKQQQSGQVQQVFKKKFPITRYPGMGATTLRKRREKLPKYVDLKLP